MGQPFSHKLFSPDAERYFNHNGSDQSVSVSVGHMVTDSIVLPDSLANIPNMLSGDRTSLVNMTLGNAATSAGTVAFRGCTIKLFSILATVLTIGNCVFYECDMLENVIFVEYEGWYISPDEGVTTGDALDFSDPVKNAEYLSITYAHFYWYALSMGALDFDKQLKQ